MPQKKTTEEILQGKNNKKEVEPCPPISKIYFKEASFVRTVFVAEPMPGVAIDQVMAKDYWVHVAPYLKVGTRIEVLPQDKKYYAELIVTASGSNWASVTLHAITKLDSEIVPVPDSLYDVEHRGMISKFSLIRKSDRSVMKDGFDSAGQAYAFLVAHPEVEG